MKVNEAYFSALNKKYAMGAFNFYNLESLKGILNAAEKLNTPVIVATSESAIKYMGKEFLKAAITAARKSYTCPFYVHLDHGKDLQICKTAISIGFDSVMIDASSLPFEQNVKLTKSVVDYAHKKGVWVEGELGTLGGIEDEVSGTTKFTNPDEAKKFVELTGVDSLAIAIGTSHGINKFLGEAKINFDVLKKIQKKVKNTPLVLHGASSVNPDTINKINKLGGKLKNAVGVPENILEELSTKYNVCKINVDSDIRLQTTLAVREYLHENRDAIDPRKYLGFAIDKITELTMHKIKNVFKTKSVGKR